MDLIAGPKCYYRGKFIPEGTRFTALRQYGRALLAMKRARIAPQTTPASYAHRAFTQTQRVDMQAARDEGQAQGAGAPVFSPLDHDHDGRPGGSIAAPASDELKTLRARYTEILGKRPYPGWDAETLLEKIGAHMDDGAMTPAEVRSAIGLDAAPDAAEAEDECGAEDEDGTTIGPQGGLMLGDEQG